MKDFIREHGAPFLLIIALLAAAALTGDFILHRAGLSWIGRYLGIPGVLLILLSLLYSMRKRGRIQAGSPRGFLQWHEASAWFGSLLVLIHSGVHFNAVLPWLATIAMGVNVVSGLAGKYLLKHAREHLAGTHDVSVPVHEALPGAFVLDLVARWRRIHIPIFIVFSTLALGHIVSIFLFWGWR